MHCLRNNLSHRAVYISKPQGSLKEFIGNELANPALS